MIIEKMKQSYYTEPYKPYGYIPPFCISCMINNATKNKMYHEGKEDGNRLYSRLVCSVNSEHSSGWTYICKRPLRFRINKILKRI